MNEELRTDPSFKPWGPLISPHYQNEAITKADIIVASVVWGLTVVNAIITIWLGYGQTKSSKSPLRSTYVWMIWLELTVCFCMGLECFMHLLKIIPPSFAFYFTILFFWCIQVQLLLQIIINRIRVIVLDRKRSRSIMIAVATFVTAINISVFCIWIPARLQISHRYHVINEYWDRTEKVLYLIIDGVLNYYFLKTVKANLISNGLTKYNKLVQFNQRIIAVSMLMDVMIIVAMSIPNSFVYIQFHPLAYLVKLNIEMTMANLIKRIALSTARKTGKPTLAEEFRSSSHMSSSDRTTCAGTGKNNRSSTMELASIVSCNADSKHGHDQIVSFSPKGNQIKTTQEIIITHEPKDGYYQSGRRESETEVTGNYYKDGVKIPDAVIEEISRNGTPRSKSLGSETDGADSLKRIDSDDEIALVCMDRGRVRNRDER